MKSIKNWYLAFGDPLLATPDSWFFIGSTVMSQMLCGLLACSSGIHIWIEKPLIFPVALIFILYFPFQMNSNVQMLILHRSLIHKIFHFEFLCVFDLFRLSNLYRKLSQLFSAILPPIPTSVPCVSTVSDLALLYSCCFYTVRGTGVAPRSSLYRTGRRGSSWWSPPPPSPYLRQVANILVFWSRSFTPPPPKKK
jgi:hypothetical protein